MTKPTPMPGLPRGWFRLTTRELRDLLTAREAERAVYIDNWGSPEEANEPAGRVDQLDQECEQLEDEIRGRVMEAPPEDTPCLYDVQMVER
jgi:hypothetical protein